MSSPSATKFSRVRKNQRSGLIPLPWSLFCERFRGRLRSPGMWPGALLSLKPQLGPGFSCAPDCKPPPQT
jgi:hypothetical protein